MANIKLYGQPTSTVEYFKMMIKRKADKANIKLNIEEITDVRTFIKEKIQTIPTVKLNEHIQMSFDGIDINAFIQEVNLALLNDEGMGSLKKINVPVDFSECSENALMYAINLAKILDGTIDICHYYRPHSSDIHVMDMSQSREIYQEQFNTLVKDIKESLREDTKNQITIKHEFKVGFPIQEILQKAEDEEAVIVMGTTGASTGIKTFFGSVSTDVAAKTRNPIILIPNDVEFKPYKKIVVALDDKQIDNTNLKLIYQLSSMTNARVDFVHVTETDQQSYISIDSDKLPRYEGFKNSQYSEIIAQNVNEGLQLYCEEEAADLMVIFNNHRNLISKIFNPSVAKQMTISSHHPLLILSNKI